MPALETRLEKRFGFTRSVELANACINIAKNPWRYLRYQWLCFVAFCRRQPVVVIHISMPQYLESLGDLPARLRDRGMAVFIFCEWRTEAFPHYKVEAPAGVRCFYDCWYFLPFTGARLAFVTAARKHRYFPAFARRVHCFHGLASLSGFPKDGFISYDVFFCAGPHQFEEIECYLRVRGLTNRLLLKAGYPKLDQLHQKYRSSPTPVAGDRPVVLYCPTYYSADPSFDQSLARCSTIVDLAPRILEVLLERFSVIFRPHPLNLKHGNIRNEIDALRAKFDGHPHFRYDDGDSYFPTYLASDAMVSDISGTAFTYALALGKPVVFLDRGVEGEGIHFEKRSLVGALVTDVDQLVACVQGLLRDPAATERAESVRAAFLYHFSNSADYFEQASVALAEGQPVPESKAV